MIKFLVLIILISVSLFLSRVQIATWAIQTYAASNKQNLNFEITELTFNQIKLKNIQLNTINSIPKLEVSYDPWKMALQRVMVEVDSLDAESIKNTLEQLFPQNSAAKTPVTFDNAQSYCQKLKKIELQIKWRELVIGDQRIPFQLVLSNEDHDAFIQWNDQKNSQGQIYLKCHSEAILVSSPQLRFEIKNTSFNGMNIADFSLKLKSTSLEWENTTPLKWSTDGFLNLDYSQNKQTHLWSLPRFELNGYYNFDGTLTAKFNIPELSWGHIKKGDQISGLSISGDLIHAPNLSKIKGRLRDKTKELFADDLEVLKTSDALEIKANIDKTQFKFNNQHASFIPSTKDLVKTISGEFKLGGHIIYRNDKWLGSLKAIGNHISTSSEYGEYEDVSFSHQISSLPNFSTPPNQWLKIKRINMGPGAENIDALYTMPDLKTINVQKFSVHVGKGDLFAENFTIYPQKKRIENFLAQIVNVDLETLLAIGLKETVKAQGTLHGHLGITYQGQRPLFKGLLTDPKQGWIQYRGTLQQQASHLSLTDGPMDILNNYLYNYHYQNLSLTISSDLNYDMDMTLAALGHNPDYLGGKPLKLNVNLQQNLLAALQSIMLTYDLPNRIREKFEKVTE